MKEYKVFMHELHIQQVIVQANSPEEARECAARADGEYGDCTYERVLDDESEWEVEEA